jgi:3-carboxy-cis,cis-muconate cycloisomerase
MDSICPMACELVTEMNQLLTCIRLVPARMRQNLEISGAFIAAENAMMVLAPAIGRNHAHDVLHHAVAEAAATGAALTELLLKDEQVRSAVGEPALRAALDPANYTGRSAAMAKEMAAAARIAADTMRQESPHN